jgi:hypothetical protein
VRTGTKRNGRIAGRINRQIQRVVCGREVVTGTLPHRAHGYICVWISAVPLHSLTPKIETAAVDETSGNIPVRGPTTHPNEHNVWAPVLTYAVLLS